VSCGPFLPVLPGLFIDQPFLAVRADCRVEPAVAALGTNATFFQTAPIPVGVCSGFLTFAETLAEDYAGGQWRYTFSVDRGTTFKWWNGSAWVVTPQPGAYAQANPASALTAPVLAALEVPGGFLVVRAWWQGDGIGRDVLESFRLDVSACLPVAGLALPETGYYDADQSVIVTTSESGVERRRLKRPTRRKAWRLRWENLTTDESQALRAWEAAKGQFSPWLWEDWSTVDPGQPVLGETYTVRFLRSPEITPANQSQTRFNATAELVVA